MSCPGRVKGQPQGEGVRVLFIGGSGIISSACSRLAAEQDIDLFVLNRGRTQDRPLPAVVTVLRGDAFGLPVP